MLQVIIIVVAVLILLTGIKALTPSGLDIGAGGRKLTGRPAKIVGGIIIAVAIGMIAFAVVGLPWTLGK